MEIVALLAIICAGLLGLKYLARRAARLEEEEEREESLRDEQITGNTRYGAGLFEAKVYDVDGQTAHHSWPAWQPMVVETLMSAYYMDLPYMKKQFGSSAVPIDRAWEIAYEMLKEGNHPKLSMYKTIEARQRLAEMVFERQWPTPGSEPATNVHVADELLGADELELEPTPETPDELELDSGRHDSEVEVRPGRPDTPTGTVGFSAIVEDDEEGRRPIAAIKP